MGYFKNMASRLGERVREIGREANRVAREDPRRIMHSLKVGLALATVSCLYYVHPLYKLVGANAMWAVMTVVTVFEFSAGATVNKGINGGAATLVAGALGVGAHHVATMSDQKLQSVLLALFVFLQAAMATFARLFPRIAAMCDYGLQTFILTFPLISVLGFRDDEILKLANMRLLTVMIGCVACVIISVFVCPVWAGQDLHNLISSNLLKLSNFLQDFVDEYFQDTEDGQSKDVDKKKTNVEGYKIVLNTKSAEESLANFARWEPCHGRFRFRHPWDRYLETGELVRQCACRINTLHSYLQADVHVSGDIKKNVKESLRRISFESSIAMKELSQAIRTMTKPSASSRSHIMIAQSAAKELTGLLISRILKNIEQSELITLVTISSLLTNIVDLTKKISESVHHLSSVAWFQDNTETIDSSEEANSCNNKVIVTIVDESSHDNPKHEVSTTET